jgi:hypothetical protein
MPQSDNDRFPPLLRRLVLWTVDGWSFVALPAAVTPTMPVTSTTFVRTNRHGCWSGPDAESGRSYSPGVAFIPGEAV